MPRMTKTQARKRLNEAKAKVMAVYIGSDINNKYMSAVTTQDMAATRQSNFIGPCVTTQDMAAIEKILDKCLKRIG